MGNDINSIKASRVVRRIVQIVCYFLSLDDNRKMNYMKLVKLIWAADRMHARRYGRTITGADYYALKHGPVCSIALDVMKNDEIYIDDDDRCFISYYLTCNPSEYSIAMSVEPDYSLLSKTNKDIIRNAYDKLAMFDEKKLADDISHRYPEWKEYSAKLRGGCGRVLIDQTLFFEDPCCVDKYFKEDSRILELAKERFVENEAIRGYLV